MSNDATVNDLPARHDELSSRLTLLADNPDLDAGQRELARAWRDRLEAVCERAVAPLNVAFLAQVGRGKSSLIAAATGLRLKKDGSPKVWSVLPVGDGRTTLGETRISFESRDDILLEVEPIPRAELELELHLFSRDLWAANVGNERGGASAQAGEELYALLRAWLAPDVDDPRKLLDELARGASGSEALEQELLARLDLDQRTRPLIGQFSNDEIGLQQLRATLAKLMDGELPGAPAPKAVRLRLPIGDLGQDVATIIDTQGIDSKEPEVTIRGRRDIQTLVADPDTLLIVCSEFESAPDPVSRNLLTFLAELQSQQKRTEDRPRLLIVDRREVDADDRVRHLRARRNRVEQCKDELRRASLAIPDENILAIDARSETAELQQLLGGMVLEARGRRSARWSRVQHDSLEALSTFDDVEFASRAREIDLKLRWTWDATVASEPVCVDGLAALADFISREFTTIFHWSHLHAAIRRRGRYRQLDLAELGARVASFLTTRRHADAWSRLHTEAKQLATTAGSRLDKHIELRVTQYAASVDSYRNDIVGHWHTTLSDYFESPQLKDLWSWCESRWGQGSGYIQAIANRFREESERAKLPTPIIASVEDRLPPRPDSFTLRQVRVQNFRGIETASIALTNTTTVIVGDNGLGKTGWLEAIAAGVGALLPGMGAGPPPELSADDVRQVIREINGVSDLQHQFPLELEIEATVQGHPIKWKRGIEAISGETEVRDDDALLVISKAIGDEIRSHSPRQLPVLVYYGTQRLWPPDLEPDLGRREVGSRLDGYRDCLKAASTHRHMLDWVRKYTYAELQDNKPVVQLRAIERAVVSCVEDAKRFHYDIKREELMLTMHDGQVFSFRMLSDGYRNIVAMVADIAWRASVLNPQLGERAAALAEGVVLIDEIDLHLHPKWQRRVLADLRRAFPKLQLIATTHSPFIIQSLQPGQLVNLDPNAAEAPYANESPEDIAENVMGVDVPQRSERRRREYEVATRYYDLLDRMPDADEAELARLKAELDELTAPYADNQAFVAFLERKRALAEAELP
ncbi:MAG: AAA family ATPase [Deltaproteobacteria bacterium]|nr:AAA family ATPase [Deltaproteobacteria bacterium]